MVSLLFGDPGFQGQLHRDLWALIFLLGGGGRGADCFVNSVTNLGVCFVI